MTNEKPFPSEKLQVLTSITRDDWIGNKIIGVKFK